MPPLTVEKLLCKETMLQTYRCVTIMRMLLENSIDCYCIDHIE